MLKILVKKQLFDLFRSLFIDQKKNKGRSKASTILSVIGYFLLIVVLLGAIFTAMSLMLCAGLCGAGLTWVYFAITSLVAIFLGVFGSVFNTYSSLYLAKDNDLLLSMPIPVKTVMASRLVSVFLMGALYCSVVSIPASVVFWCVMPQTLLTVIGSALLVLVIPFIVLLLSCILGYGVARISVKVKSKSFVTVLASLCFLAAYYIIYFKALDVFREIDKYMGQISDSLRRIAPIYMLGRMGEGDLLSMAVIIGATALLVYLICALIARSFIRLTTSSGKEKKRSGKVQYRTASAHGAFLRKEFGRLASSANYMLNCALGTVFMIAAGGALLFKGDVVREALTQTFGAQPGFLPVLAATVCCGLASMNDSASASVSLEGKSVWIPQSMPVDLRTVLRAKLDVQLIVTLPLALIVTVYACTVLKLGGLYTALVAGIVAVFCLFTAVWGLMLNLLRPVMDWTNEIFPIKQSFSVSIALLSAFAYIALLIGVYLLLGIEDSVVYLACALALTALLDGLGLWWIMTKGARIFSYT